MAIGPQSSSEHKTMKPINGTHVLPNRCFVPIAPQVLGDFLKLPSGVEVSGASIEPLSGNIRLHLVSTLFPRGDGTVMLLCHTRVENNIKTTSLSFDLPNSPEWVWNVEPLQFYVSRDGSSSRL